MYPEIFCSSTNMEIEKAINCAGITSSHLREIIGMKAGDIKVHSTNLTKTSVYSHPLLSTPQKINVL